MKNRPIALATLFFASACATTPTALDETPTDRQAKTALALRAAIDAPLEAEKERFEPSEIAEAIEVVQAAKARRNERILDRASAHLDALGVGHDREAHRLVIQPNDETPLGQFARRVAETHHFAIVYEPRRLAGGAAAVCTTDAIALDHRSILRGRPDQRIVRHELVHVRQQRDMGKRGGPIAVGHVLGTLHFDNPRFTRMAAFEIEAYGSDVEDELRRLAQDARRYGRMRLVLDETDHDDPNSWMLLQGSLKMTMHSATLVGAAFEAAVEPDDIMETDTFIGITAHSAYFTGGVRLPLAEGEGRDIVPRRLAEGYAHARAQGSWAAATYGVMKRIAREADVQTRTQLLCALDDVADARPDPRDPAATWAWDDAAFLRHVEEVASSCDPAAPPLRTPVVAR